MARFTTLQRVRLKRNIYQTANSGNMREAFAEGQTGFISRVPPNNQHVQHDDNCIYYLMLDSGFTEGTGGYPMDEAGWLVLATEIEDIDEQSRLEAVAAEMRQVSDDYWNVGQAATQARPTVQPPRQGYQPSEMLGRFTEEALIEIRNYGVQAQFAPRFTPEVSNYQRAQVTGAWLDEQSDRVDHARDAVAYMQTGWHSENPFD